MASRNFEQEATAKLRNVKHSIETTTQNTVNKVSKTVSDAVDPVQRKVLDPDVYVRFLQGFARFLAKRNLIDTGIGLVIGSAFASMIQNLVDDLLTPLLGLVVGSRMANWFIVLRKGAKALQQSSKTTKFKYVTFEEALKDGAVILNVGKAAESVLRFICVAGAVFTLYRVAMKTWEANKRTLSPILFPGEKTASTRECGFCISEVPARATKCKYCTSGLHPLPEYAVSKDSKPQLTSAKDD